jgi:hypothetical protein
MKNKNKNTKSKSVKPTRRSQKGKWGHVGAPPKKTSFPKGAFTMATLFSRNKNQCELSLRTKVEKGVKAGVILALIPKKQPGGAVGRPKSVFVLKESFIASKMELAIRTVRLFSAATSAPVATPPQMVAVPASPAPEAPSAPAPVAVASPVAIETVSVPSAEPSIG